MTFTQLTAGQDAILTVQGDVPTNDLTITSSDNTFEELLPGVTVTVNDETTSPVTVTTEQDVEAITASVEELVTKVNDLFSRIATSTANNPDGDRTVLQGNREARRAADAAPQRPGVPGRRQRLHLARPGRDRADQGRHPQLRRRRPSPRPWPPTPTR